jgi:hypothetical protein
VPQWIAWHTTTPTTTQPLHRRRRRRTAAGAHRKVEIQGVGDRLVGEEQFRRPNASPLDAAAVQCVSTHMTQPALWWMQSQD